MIVYSNDHKPMSYEYVWNKIKLFLLAYYLPTFQINRLFSRRLTISK